jgi:hypothetical protein
MRRACAPPPLPRRPATLRAPRSTAHAANAPQAAHCHTSRARSPPTRAPMPPQFWQPSRGSDGVSTQHTPIASQGRMCPARPPWHPNSPRPLSFQPTNRRALPDNPHHLHTTQSLPCIQSQLRPSQEVCETPLETPLEASSRNQQDAPRAHRVATICTHPVLRSDQSDQLDQLDQPDRHVQCCEWVDSLCIG